MTTLIPTMERADHLASIRAGVSLVERRLADYDDPEKWPELRDALNQAANAIEHLRSRAFMAAERAPGPKKSWQL